MVRTVQQLLADARELSVEDRLRLVQELAASVRTPEEQSVADEWDLEAERRVDEIERGAVKTVPVEDSIARARAALNDARQVSSRR